MAVDAGRKREHEEGRRSGGQPGAPVEQDV